MTTELDEELERRARVHAALGDAVRLSIVDILDLSDASPSELMTALGIRSNLLAHHLKVLREAGLVTSRHSQGDGRKQYLRLVRDGFVDASSTSWSAPRVVFVCTANSARSHLAAALWRSNSTVPTISAGTHPAERINPGTVAVAERNGLELPLVKPQALADVARQGDLVVTVCDLAHEELPEPAALHWSVPDPVALGTEQAFNTAYDDIESRVRVLSSRLSP